MRSDLWRQIECLACGERRLVVGRRAGDTGECPRCGYLGWCNVDDHDRTTGRMIPDGPPAKRPQRGDGLSGLVVPSPARSTCSWGRRRPFRRELPPLA